MATYTYVLKDKDGHLVTLNFDRDITGERFNIGDTLNFGGSVYNSGGNDVGAFTTLDITFGPSGSGSWWIKASIPISVPVGRTVSFSNASLVFEGSDCKNNEELGGLAVLCIGYRLHSPSTSQILTGNSRSDKVFIYVNDTTIAPVYNLSSGNIIDTLGYKDRFGDCVQSNSYCMLSVLMNDIDTGTEPNASGYVRYANVTVEAPSGETVYDSGRITLRSALTKLDVVLETFKTFGEHTCTLSLTGYYGKTSTTSTTFTVLPYAAPSLSLNGTSPVAKRFRAEQDDYGATVYTEAPDGKNILTSFIGGIQAFNGLNTFNISAKYGIDGADEMTDVGIVASGTDAGSILYGYQDTIGFLPVNAFSADNRYQVHITLTDYFGNSATITGYVEKAVFRFRVTENGVAVGMNSTGTSDHKKFEVAPTHESFFHGGISGVTNYPAVGVEELTGGKWIDRKPIYRYVLRTTTTLTGANGKIGNIPADVDTVVNMHGTWIHGDNNWFPLPHVYYKNLNNNIGYYVSRADNGIYLQVGSSYSGTKTVIVIIEYTKSTD